MHNSAFLTKRAALVSDLSRQGHGAFLAGLLTGNSTVRAVTMRATLPIQSVLMVVFFYRFSRLCSKR
jgi:hypothetical protein